MNIVEEVKKLHFPVGQYVVLGSTSLAIRGIRESQDVNIAVLPALFAQLRSEGNWQMTEMDGRVHLMRGAVEVLSDVRIRGYDATAADLIRSADMVQGIPCIDLAELRNFKRARGSRQDAVDIGLIEDYLLHHSK